MRKARLPNISGQPHYAATDIGLDEADTTYTLIDHVNHHRKPFCILLSVINSDLTIV